MNAAAALTRSEIHALSDADRTCEDANRQLASARAHVHRDHTAADTGVFEESLRLKNTLDACEQQAKSSPSWDALAVLVNCEYRLYVLNQTTPLRNNPFLSHWVEAVQRLGTPAAQRDANTDGSILSDEISTVRMELIKALLQSRNPSQFARASPRQLYNNYVELRQTSLFNIRTYVRMLEEEGIYERTPEPDSDSPESTSTASDNKLNEFQRWKLGMLSRAILPRFPNHAAARAHPAGPEHRAGPRDRRLHPARPADDGADGARPWRDWRRGVGAGAYAREWAGGPDKGRQVVAAFHAKSHPQGFVAARIDILRNSGDMR